MSRNYQERHVLDKKSQSQLLKAVPVSGTAPKTSHLPTSLDAESELEKERKQTQRKIATLATLKRKHGNLIDPTDESKKDLHRQLRYIARLKKQHGEDCDPSLLPSRIWQAVTSVDTPFNTTEISTPEDNNRALFPRHPLSKQESPKSTPILKKGVTAATALSIEKPAKQKTPHGHDLLARRRRTLRFIATHPPSFQLRKVLVDGGTPFTVSSGISNKPTNKGNDDGNDDRRRGHHVHSKTPTPRRLRSWNPNLTEKDNAQAIWLQLKRQTKIIPSSSSSSSSSSLSSPSPETNLLDILDSMSKSPAATGATDKKAAAATATTTTTTETEQRQDRKGSGAMTHGGEEKTRGGGRARGKSSKTFAGNVEAEVRSLLFGL